MEKSPLSAESLETYSIEALENLQETIEQVLQKKGWNKKTAQSITSNSSLQIPEVIRNGVHHFKARVQSVNPASLKETFLEKFDRCLLGVSLRSPSSSGSQLAASIKWIGQNFKKCLLVHGDYLFKYTLQVTGPSEIPIEEAKKQALEIGKQLEIEFQQMIEENKGMCEFSWYPTSRVAEHPNFLPYLEIFQKIDAENVNFSLAIDDFVNVYHSRVADEETDPERSLAQKKWARKYVLDELALFCCLCEMGWNVFVYPGPFRIFQLIAEGVFPEVPEPIKSIVNVSLRLDRGALFYRGEGDELLESGQLSVFPAQYVHLQNLSLEDWEILMTYVSKVAYQKGDILTKKNDQTRDLFILSSGHVEILVEKPGQKQGVMSQLAVRGPGFVIGEQAFLYSAPRTATIAAITPCEVLVLSYKKFTKMLTNHPQLAVSLLLDLIHSLSARLSSQY